ncbi:DNA-binding protein [Candidatus Poribacteria bacterium]|nr:MAG: DNA-binding protein [Candidatus Poribacteria bacterium]
MACPFALRQDKKPLWQAHREKQFATYVTATTLTDIFYLSHRHAGLAKAWQSVHYLLNHLPIISVGIDELRAAATFEGQDFEDTLQIACATCMQLDAIVICCPQGVRRRWLVLEHLSS